MTIDSSHAHVELPKAWGMRRQTFVIPASISGYRYRLYLPSGFHWGDSGGVWIKSLVAYTWWV